MSHNFKVTPSIMAGGRGSSHGSRQGTHSGKDRSLVFHAVATFRKHRMRRKCGPSDTWLPFPLWLHPRHSTTFPNSPSWGQSAPTRKPGGCSAHSQHSVDRHPRIDINCSRQRAAHPLNTIPGPQGSVECRTSVLVAGGWPFVEKDQHPSWASPDGGARTSAQR